MVSLKIGFISNFHENQFIRSKSKFDFKILVQIIKRWVDKKILIYVNEKCKKIKNRNKLLMILFVLSLSLIFLFSTYLEMNRIFRCLYSLDRKGSASGFVCRLLVSQLQGLACFYHQRLSIN